MNGKTERSQAGFTLAELLIVIAVIGILATIAVPVFLGQRTKAMRTEAMTNLEALRLLQEQYYAENGEYADCAACVCSANESGNIALIQNELPSFKPGTPGDLFFSYCVKKNFNYSLVANTPCFVARAFGNNGSPIEGHELRVDCNNEKNF